MKTTILHGVSIMMVSTIVGAGFISPGYGPGPLSFPAYAAQGTQTFVQAPKSAPLPPPPSPQLATTQTAPSKPQPFTKPGDDHVNYPYEALVTPNDSLYSNQWHLPKIAAPAAWETTTGSSQTTLAIIDTGFSMSHPDLSSRWWTSAGEMGVTVLEGSAPNCTSRGLTLDKSCNNRDDDSNGYKDDWRGWDFSAADNNTNAGATSPSSSNAGHGTFVAGLAAAASNNAAGVAGVNWGVKIMPLQALDDTGNGYTDDVAGAVTYAADNGADVISLSLGSTYNDPYLRAAIQAAIAQGVTVVAAAGNDGCNCMVYPANFPEVVAVGSSTQADARASFSSYGANLDIVAPGVSMCSTSWTNASPNGYGCGGQGTSYSTPLVSAAAALLKGRYTSAAPTEVLNRLTSGADKISGYTFGQELGYGRLNLYRSLLQSSSPGIVGYGDEGAVNAQVSLSGSSTIGIPCATSTCAYRLYGPDGQIVSITSQAVDSSAPGIIYIDVSTLNLAAGAWIAITLDSIGLPTGAQALVFGITQ